MKRLLLSLVCAFPALLQAQAFPSRPITLMNGFPPGGGPDILARQIATAMSQRLGVNVIVENRPGATGTIGAAAVARAAPDGHTLLFGVAANLVVGPATLKGVPYDPVKSFAPVTEIARGPYLLVVASKLPVTTVRDLVAHARANPGKLNFASVGPGSPHHYAGELLKRTASIDIIHVPYKGGGPAYAGFLAGEVQLLFDSMPGPQAHLQAGTVRALAVTGTKRLALMPSVPTLAEEGFPGVDVHFMFGVMAPVGTPRDVVLRLNEAIAQSLGDAAIRGTLARQAVEPSPGTPEAFGALVASEFARWKEIVVQTGFRPD